MERTVVTRLRFSTLRSPLRFKQEDDELNIADRFKIPEQDYPIASRIIRDTIDSNLVKPEDPESKSKKHARYVPFWA